MNKKPLSTEKLHQSNETRADKRNYYKTARARISCAIFKKGDFVAVRYLNQGDQGTHWFLVSATKKGLDELGKATAYPQHHLTDFVL